MVDLHFVVPRACEASLDADPDAQWRCFARSEEVWSWQSAILLSRAGIDVTMGTAPRAGAINFVPASMLVGRRFGNERYYVVSMAADKVLIPWVHAHIVQNAAQVDKTRYWIHHWPQPGLIARSAQRGQRVINVGFAGLPINCGLSASDFSAICGSAGLNFRVMSPDDWNDYSDIDVLVGIRDFSGGTYPRKPASKLFNAWLAGVPFIGGADSAYEQVGTPGLNYLQAHSVQEFEEVLARLVEDSALYDRLVREGAAASEMCRRDVLTTMWIKTVETIQEDYLRWSASSNAVKLGRWLFRNTRVRFQRLRQARGPS